MPHESPARARIAYPVMVIAPLFFASNLVFGRSVISEVSPFTLALIRWLAVALALAPIVYAERAPLYTLVRHRWGLMVMLSFLAMWICGGGVYFGLQWTTATNAILIYTTSPVIILVLEHFFRGRRIAFREVAGAAIAFIGVAIIVFRGDPSILLSMSFNAGDIILLAAAIAWAAYSMLYRSPDLRQASNFALLGTLAAIGALLLLPAAAIEWVWGPRLPASTQAWTGIAGIVIFASLLAFMTFQFGIRELGAPLAGIFMYLLPPYGVILAVTLLGETFETFHLAGIALVMSGVILATFPGTRKIAG